MNTDNWIPMPVEVRESTCEALFNVFRQMRESAGVSERVMKERDCFQELLQTAISLSERLISTQEDTSDLAFFPTEVLLNELGKRYQQLLVAGEMSPRQGTSYIHVQHFGSKISAIGLAEFAKLSILHAADQGTPPPGVILPDHPTT